MLSIGQRLPLAYLAKVSIPDRDSDSLERKSFDDRFSFVLVLIPDRDSDSLERTQMFYERFRVTKVSIPDRDSDSLEPEWSRQALGRELFQSLIGIQIVWNEIGNGFLGSIPCFNP